MNDDEIYMNDDDPCLVCVHNAARIEMLSGVG